MALGYNHFVSPDFLITETSRQPDFEARVLWAEKPGVVKESNATEDKSRRTSGFVE
jgi:hypothetical protein